MEIARGYEAASFHRIIRCVGRGFLQEAVIAVPTAVGVATPVTTPEPTAGWNPELADKDSQHAPCSSPGGHSHPPVQTGAP